MIYGELPDGDKKCFSPAQSIINFANVFITRSIPFCLFEYLYCDFIIFQMDYRTNNKAFYIQGMNMKKGCLMCNFHCFSLFCCCCSFTPDTLFLRENIDPNNPDFNVGNKRGAILGMEQCSGDKYFSYITQADERGPRISRKGCCCQSYF